MENAGFHRGKFCVISCDFLSIFLPFLSTFWTSFFAIFLSLFSAIFTCFFASFFPTFHTLFFRPFFTISSTFFHDQKCPKTAKNCAKTSKNAKNPKTKMQKNEVPFYPSKSTFHFRNIRGKITQKQLSAYIISFFFDFFDFSSFLIFFCTLKIACFFAIFCHFLTSFFRHFSVHF